MKRFILIVTVAVLLASCGKAVQQKLYVFNWTDYIEPELIKQFEAEYNCKVIYDTYNSNENMLTKILNSKASYDIAVPSGDHVAIMIKKDLLEKLDMSKLPNWENMDESILQKAASFDPTNEYSIPYFWGTCGLIYNRNNIPDEEMEDASWNKLGDPAFHGKNVVTMLDDAREVIGAALVTAGYSVNETSEEALDAAREYLKNWDKNISQFDSDSFKNEIQDGTTWLAQAYNGDALQIMAENEDIGFVLPKEGASLWVDCMVILKNAENKDLAYKFINFLNEAEVAATNADYVQYATPNKAAFMLLPEDIQNDTIIYPSDDFLSKSYPLKDIGEDIIKIDKLWEDMRSNTMME